MVKVLLLKAYDNHPFGSGGERSMLELLRNFSSRGCECRAVYLYIDADFGRHSKAAMRHGMRLIDKNSCRLLLEYDSIQVEMINIDAFSRIRACDPIRCITGVINAFKPDWIWYMFFNMSITRMLADMRFSRAVAFVQDVFFPRPPDTDRPTSEHIRSLPAVIANSRFVAKTFADAWGIKPRIQTPIIDPHQFTAVNRRPKYVAMIGSAPGKGRAHFLRIAAGSPRHSFLLIGRLTDDQARHAAGLSNLEVVTERYTTGTLYADIRLLCVPSVVPEAFSRVIVEAGMNGIPALAFDTGGVTEALNGSGMAFSLPEGSAAGDGLLPLRPWTDAIEALDDEDAYARASAAARRSAFETAAKAEKECGNLVQLFRPHAQRSAER